MKNISRRNFLKTSAVMTAGLTIIPSSVLGRTYGHIAPSDKLNIAGIGVGGMGRRNLANMSIGIMQIRPLRIIRMQNVLKIGV